NPSACRGQECGWQDFDFFRHTPLESVEFLDAEVAVADKLPGEVTAAVDLQGNAALVGVPLVRVGELHELHALDPGSDPRRIAGDAGPQFVPLAVLPEARPLFRGHGQREGRLLFFDPVGSVEEVKVAGEDAAGKPFAED